MSTRSESPIDLDTNNNELLNSDTTSSQADSISENDLIFSSSNCNLKRNVILVRIYQFLKYLKRIFKLQIHFKLNNDNTNSDNIYKQASSNENLTESSIYDTLENVKAKETSSKKSVHRTRNPKRFGLIVSHFFTSKLNDNHLKFNHIYYALFYTCKEIIYDYISNLKSFFL